GFGEVVALDPATGDEIWTQDIDAQGGGSATYFDGRVYVASRDSVGWAINAETGRVDWQLTGTPSPSSYLGGAGPAVTDDLAIFPFPSGELLAVFRRGGIQRWTATVLGGREGVAYGRISDLAADPVVAGGQVFAANPAGRLVALSLGDGSRLWTALEGAQETPAVAGGSVFMVTDQNALMRLDAATGTRIWAQQLPLFEQDRARRHKSIFAHKGPVLAGGRLWVASSDDLLRGFDPVNGAQTASVALPGGAATPPVLAGGTMYVVTGRGQLVAFR
ncbi:MAG: PQQ-binding-like beta-propeller repeat protein, partial [Pseudomonadota bacterium]